MNMPFTGNVRPITIKKGMTYIKTATKRLERIIKQLEEYGAWDSKNKIPLVSTDYTLETNHSKAKAEVKALLQSFFDLTAEIELTREAMDRTNLTATITVAGKTMTIQRALILRRMTAPFYKSLRTAYNKTVKVATSKVEQYNVGVVAMNKDATPEAVEALKAQLEVFIPRDTVDNVENFLAEFLQEVDGALDDVNGTQSLIWGDDTAIV
jgi:hypothetical protein